MANNTFDRVVIDPTLEQAVALLEQAADLANAGARARTLSASGLVRMLTEKWDTQGSAQWDDGGGVPNSYRGAADTTVLGFAFFVAPDGRRHLRVYGARWTAPKSSYGRGDTKSFGLTSREFDRASVESLVYPALQCALATRKKDKGLVPEMLRTVEADPLDIATWSALADYLTENGHWQGSEPVAAKHARAALAAVQAILEPATVAVA